MSSKRNVTNRQPLFGRSRSHAFNTVNRKFKLNLQTKRFFVPELNRFVRLKVTTREIRTIDKVGLRAFLNERGLQLEAFLD